MVTYNRTPALMWGGNNVQQVVFLLYLVIKNRPLSFQKCLLHWIAAQHPRLVIYQYCTWKGKNTLQCWKAMHLSAVQNWGHNSWKWLTFEIYLWKILSASIEFIKLRRRRNSLAIDNLRNKPSFYDCQNAHPEILGKCHPLKSWAISLFIMFAFHCEHGNKREIEVISLV